MSEHPPKNPGPEISAYLKKEIFESLTNQILVEDRLSKIINNIGISGDSSSLKNAIVALANVGKITNVEGALIVQYFNDYIRQHKLHITEINLTDELTEIKEDEVPAVESKEEEITEDAPKEKFGSLELMDLINESVGKIKPLVRKKIKKILDDIAKGGKVSSFPDTLKEVNGDLDEKNKKLILQIFDKYMKTHEVVLGEKKPKTLKPKKEKKNKTIESESKTEDMQDPIVSSEEKDVGSVSVVKNGNGKKLKTLDLSQLSSLIDQKSEEPEIDNVNIEKKIRNDIVSAPFLKLGWTKKDMRGISEKEKARILKYKVKNYKNTKDKYLNTDAILHRLDDVLKEKTPYESFDTKVYVGEKFTDTKDYTTYRVKAFIRDESKPEDLTDAEEFDYYNNKDMVVFEGPFNYETGRNFERKISNKKFGELLESGTLVKADDNTENTVVLPPLEQEIENLSSEIEDLTKEIKRLEKSKMDYDIAERERALNEREEKSEALDELIHKANEKYITEGDIKRVLERNGVILEEGDEIIPIGVQRFLIKHPFTKFEGKTLYTFTEYKKNNKYINKSGKLQYSETDRYSTRDVTEKNVTEREYLGIMLQMIENGKTRLKLLEDEAKRRGLIID